MLDYTEFPLKRTVYYILYAPSMAFLIRFIIGLSKEQAFPGLTEQLFMLGVSLGVCVGLLLLCSMFIDRTPRTDMVILIASVVPSVIWIVWAQIGYPSVNTPTLEWILSLSLVCGLGVLLMGIVIQLNKTIIIRFRARVVGCIVVLALSILATYDILEAIGVFAGMSVLNVASVVAIVCALFTTVFGPWKWGRHELTVKGNAFSYFIPTFFAMCAHILWYFSVRGQLMRDFLAFNHRPFISLGVESGLSLYEPLFLAAGVAVAAVLNDLRGRKTTFSVAILLIGLLTIFGSVFYGVEVINENTVAVVNAAPLLIIERLVEGILLCQFIFLVWTELGSPRTRARRIASVWSFFIGYIALFLAVLFGVYGFSIPTVVVTAGQQFAVVFSLVALYMSANTSELLGHEVEIEELRLDFDEAAVKKTVDSLVSQEDFESIRSQLEIVEGTQELSDSEMAEILGDEESKSMSLRTVTGIGPKMEVRLKAAGYTTVAQLAGETPTRLVSKVKGLTTATAEKIIRAARERMREALKK